MAGGEMEGYRGRIRAKDLMAYRVKVKESDLLILSTHNRGKGALEALLEARMALEAYIALHPDFATSLTPVEVESQAPPLVRQMAQAALLSGVGPMAAVAGAIAQAVGEKLVSEEGEVVVENGGDIYIRSFKERVVALFAGDSPLSMEVGVKVPGDGARGVCTSSGRIGHSLSWGRAHSVTVVASGAPLADAAATALANLVQGPFDIERTLKRANRIPGVLGAVVICEDRLGAWGELDLVPLEGS
jgi:ApbE superfamily uncharacterized protein (UPF0280 family)